MAPRLPLNIEEPLEVLVESDFEAQGRHVAEIGEAVLSESGRMHLVHHPDDLDAYRYGVARALVRRLSSDLSPWFEDGAALWLSEQWYGRVYADWLTPLVAGNLLPTVDQLTADERQADGSARIRKGSAVVPSPASRAARR